MSSVNGIRKSGKKARGRAELLRYRQGKKLTRQESIAAYCYDCTGGYVDGIEPCQNADCALHPYHPYQDRKKGRL